MRRARMLLVVGNLVLALLLVATQATHLGWARWHHDAVYAALAFAMLLAWPLLRRRRVTTLLMASLAAWSTATGLLLIYVTPGVGATGRWMTWWHSATSMAFVLAFVAHWVRNHARLSQLARRLARRGGMHLAAMGGWSLLAAVAVLSWTTPARMLFASWYFVPLSTLSFGFVAVVVTYAGLAATTPRVRAALAQDDVRHAVRGAVDTGLLASMWLATLTGLALLYFSRPLRAADAHAFAMAWHVVVSALLLGLIAVHVRFNVRPLTAHAR